MMNDVFVALKALPDKQLLDELRSFASGERSATSEVVARLAELDTRDTLLREGYTSLFAYCRETLGLSEHGALNRIEVARAARRFPAILDMLADGKVNLTTVRLLAPHLTADNFERVLAEARGKRTEEIRAMAGGLSAASKTPVRASSTSTPAAPGETSVGGKQPPVTERAASEETERNAAAAVEKPEEGRAVIGQVTTGPVPATPQRRAVTLIGPTLEKLRFAKDLLRHACPSGDENAIVDRALTLLLSDLARKKFGETDRPRISVGVNESSRYVPAEVRRVVWVRDLGRCAYVGPTGHRCEERGLLEFHHVRPFEVGGRATAENIQLRCARHNRYEAKVYFSRAEDPAESVRRVGGPTVPVARDQAARQGVTTAANSF
jgi:hypothetical protein